MRFGLLLLAAFLLFAAPAFADDYCEGRSPRSRGCSSHTSEPIIVEKVRVMPEGSIATTHDTIIRQGDRILMVIKGKDNNYDISDLYEREY